MSLFAQPAPLERFLTVPESLIMSTPPRTILGRGIYSVRDSARLTSIPARRIKRWLLGYDFGPRGDLRHSYPVLRRDFDAEGRGLWLSFADLVEVRFIDAFLKAGVSWAAIRVAAERASRLLHQDHPFSSRRFKTDGHTIMTEIAEGTSAPELLDLVEDQVALKKVIDPYLYRGLDFGPTDMVARWWHEAGHKKIVIDPARAFGKPIVAKEAVPTRVLFEALLTEQSIDRVAAVFEVSKRSVSAAIEFEKHLAA